LGLDFVVVHLSIIQQNDHNQPISVREPYHSLTNIEKVCKFPLVTPEIYRSARTTPLKSLKDPSSLTPTLQKSFEVSLPTATHFTASARKTSLKSLLDLLPLTPTLQKSFEVTLPTPTHFTAVREPLHHLLIRAGHLLNITISARDPFTTY